ncbi:MAG: hypothetical protein IPJ71_06745 [Bdellovibrionales bacterium]|nr:hypothetical protein [Bdellovibrionales bacterium]
MKNKTQASFVFLCALLSSVLCWANGQCGKLLMNAEAFGFGPSAATAQLFLELRPHMERMGYLGEGHTLALQNSLPYDDIVRLEDQASDSKIREHLRRLLSRYTHFFTSSDFRYARVAQEEGYKVGVYDPLTWFWKPFPENSAHVDLYVAQDFVGVRERIEGARFLFPEKTAVVAPIVQPLNRRSLHQRKQAVLVNLGGLSNPFVSNDLMSKFSNLLAESCALAVADQTGEIIVATNPKFAKEMPKRLNAATLSPGHIQNHLEQVRVAFMTSGLGNLIEASSAGVPVVWLPPTNDSQGQQIQLLKRRDMVDWSLDWNDFTDGPEIDYFRPQETVMKEIKSKMLMVLESREYQERLLQVLAEKVRSSLHPQSSLKIERLVDEYGQNGIKDLAEIVRKWVQDHDKR